MIQAQPLDGMQDGEILVKLTIEEYMTLKDKKQKNVGNGLKDIMEMFNCSKMTAFNISHSEWFQPAIILRYKKTLSFDKDIATKLAKEYSRANK